MTRSTALAPALVTMLLVAPVASATTITILNTDAAGIGLNDPTPATPVGGNTGTTKGAQALQAFQFAAGIWAETISSAVEIEVDASFAPLSCTEFSGTLGSAGPETVHFGFLGAPDASTWYVQSVANAIRGTDLKPAISDIGMEFNGDLGSSGCLESLSWYMGLDAGAPGGTISLASVALHEIGHGLGFLSLVDLGTGEKFNGGDDAYMVNLKDFSTGETYDDMTDGERVAASINTGGLRWIGAEVVAASGFLTSGRDPSGHVEIYAPAPQEDGSSVSHWSTSLSPDELMEPTYTGPVIDVGLAAELMLDVGWTAAPPTPTPSPGPSLDPIALVVIGETLTLEGRGFTAGSVVKAYVSTSSGATAFGPYIPTSWTSTTLDWDVPVAVDPGNGYVSMQVINTDEGFLVSNLVTAPLVGSVTDGFPTIAKIDGAVLGPMSIGVPLNYVETVVAQGSTVTISGTGFAVPLVNLYTSVGNIGPLAPLPGGSATAIDVTVPPATVTGPGSFQVVNTGTGFLVSNAVSVPIGAAITVSSVGQTGSTITVGGTGFSILTVINLFNKTSGGVQNLGGLDVSGDSRIPLTLLSETEFTFTAPAATVSGPAYVMALNPPFIPFSSSGTDPAGGFTITAP